MDELRSAELIMIRVVQREKFPEEVKALLSNKPVPNNSKVARLSPVMEDSILRVGGRLQHADIDKNQMHPILIPKLHPVTTLLIRDTHINMKHAGINATLYNL